ncbi:protein kinase [candidate division KSB1 bacterium]|nr:protein kinase [candidate division KSB1 bacterium]RQW02645.1 MAG: serine/threonine-protein kinase [candidate division KSB1 bacterium]
MASLINSTISHFRVLEQIGEGGMGSVYKAMDLRLQRAVALKFLSPALVENKKALLRFQLEAVAASAINHPNICTIYDVETVPPHHFIVMEYVNGSTLRAILGQQGRLSEWDVAWLLEQICPPLALAHEAGIVHRDIKPDNIMVVPDPPHVKITDFGLAKLAAETAEVTTAATQGFCEAEESRPALFSADAMITSLSGLMGTACYMSPEQVKKEPVDFRSDIFSIGAMLFELLTGAKLFDGATQIKVLESIATFNDIKPAALKAGIPHDWLPILTACLQNDPEQRYQSVNTLLFDVSRLKKRLRPIRSLFSGTKDSPVTSRKKSTTQILKWLALPLLAALILIFSVFGRRWLADLTSKPDAASVEMASIEVTTTSAQAYHYFLQGRQSWWRYDDAGAIRYLQMAVEADSTFAYALCLLGVLYYWHDRSAEGHNCIQIAAQQLARLTDWEKLLVQGFLAYDKDDNHSMLRFFDELVVRYPDKIDGYLGATLACEILNDYDKAIYYLRQVIEIDSSHIAAHANMANQYEWKGDLVSALSYAQKYLQLILDSNDVAGVATAYELVGTYHHFLGDAAISIPYLQKSLDIDPVSREAAQMLAEVYALDGRLDAAENVLKAALAIPIKSVERSDLYSIYGRLAAFGGRFVDALSHIEKKKTLATEENKLEIYKEVYSGHATIYGELQQHQMIRHELNSLISIFNLTEDDLAKWSSYFMIQFQCALQQKDFSLCQRWLEEGNQVCAKSWLVSASAKLAREQGDLATAEKLYLSKVEKTTHPFWGENIRDNYGLARLKLMVGDFSAAEKYCESALATRHILIYLERTIYYMRTIALLAEIYEASGNTEKALAQCDRFLLYWQHADPGTPLLLEVQERKERLLRKQIAGS